MLGRGGGSLDKREPELKPEARMRELAVTYPYLDEALAKRASYYQALDSVGLGSYASKRSPMFSVLATLVTRDMLVTKTGDPLAARERYTGYSLMHGLCSVDVAAYDMWRGCKQVYRFDPGFGRLIAGQALDSSIPAEALARMPYPILFVECPMTLDDGEALGCWMYVDDDYFVGYDEHGAAKTERNLVCLRLGQDMKTYPLVISLELGTVAAAAEEAVSYESAADRVLFGSDGERDLGHTKTIVSEAINLALYICSEHADVEVSYVPKPPTANPKKAKRNRCSFATVRSVGYRTAASLSLSKNSGSGQEGKGDRSMAPHMRRAHWHHYWTGPLDGERSCIVKWMPPIPVNTESGDVIPTVHRRKDRLSG